MFHAFRSLLRDDAGQAMAEYGLVLALVAVVCIGATQTLGTKVTNALTATGNGLP